MMYGQVNFSVTSFLRYAHSILFILFDADIKILEDISHKNPTTIVLRILAGVITSATRISAARVAFSTYRDYIRRRN